MKLQKFKDTEARLLDEIQQNIPLTSRPFKALGESLALTETDVIDVLASLKNRGIIRNMSAIFNPERLGYTLGLVAFEIPEHRIDAAAMLINAHPGVSHNYVRNHRYTIWFTLAEVSPVLFDAAVSTLAKSVRALDHLVLKTEKLFKIGVRLPIGDPSGSLSFPSQPESAQNRISGQMAGVPLNARDREAVCLFQHDLPLTERPFERIAQKYGKSLDETGLLDRGRLLMKQGIMRRYAAVLRHMKAGFSHNAMTVWNVDEKKGLEPVIRAFRKERAVTHLYLRTRVPGRWDYPLFAMMHARSESGILDIINRLQSSSGIDDYQVLRSVRELKKERVTYFSPEFGKWREKVSTDAVEKIIIKR